MSLRPAELELLAAELRRELEGAAVQKVYAPTTTRLLLELRVPGRTVTLSLCSEPGAARISAIDERLPNPPQPPAWQHVLRKALEGARLRDAEALPDCRTLLLHLTRAQINLTLALECGAASGLALLSEEAKVLALSKPVREGLRVGAVWTPPPLSRRAPEGLRGERAAGARTPRGSVQPELLEGSAAPGSPSAGSGRASSARGATMPDQPSAPHPQEAGETVRPELHQPPQPGEPGRSSRLSSDHVFLRLLHGAEALFATTERAAALKAARAPLEAKLKRLARTREKVRADGERTAAAQTFRREGELLTRHLSRLQRGAGSITLPEYLEDGSTRELTITLDPRRTPRQEVDWRFHQYRRLLRGAELAQQRLAQLDAEQRALEAQLAALDARPPEALPPAPRKKPAAQAPLPPYREYLGHGGQRIWVGRGAAHNDALTFHLARPWHLWLHARGVPGAHVVIPLEKHRAADAELLVDAAHLAVHHSDAKGEPRAEVSATQVKHVRKAKGAAPGAVTYTHEKTFVLRLEPERLQRLLATEGQAAP